MVICHGNAFRLPDRVPAIYVALQTTGASILQLYQPFFGFVLHVSKHQLCHPNLHHSVHSCPNTPCFRCRLSGHRASDCTNRRWPKDMCWRCLRTDRYKYDPKTISCLPFSLYHSHSPWECNRAQVLTLAASDNLIACSNCGQSGSRLFKQPPLLSRS